MQTQTPVIELEEPRSSRDQILDAGERLFAERGYAGVSMRDIVAGTDLRNQASLYHHFRNKRDLYEAVLSRGLGQITSRLPERRSGTAAEIDVNIDRLIDYLAEHPHMAQLIQRAALDGSRHIQRAVNGVLRPLYTHGRRAMTGLEEVWDADEVPHLAAGLYLLIFGYFANADLLKSLVGQDPLGVESVERQRRFLKTAIARLFGVDPPLLGRQP
ncbi:MAG TPA: helix-turn-helix domain-containing protein [Dehalococcoidia bacterium]|jgi:AcrR family transcriptional regulator|nr:helix-turn-helix domain-containing protein [Dehalococcoidia bacterium]